MVLDGSPMRSWPRSIPPIRLADEYASGTAGLVGWFVATGVSGQGRQPAPYRPTRIRATTTVCRVITAVCARSIAALYARSTAVDTALINRGPPLVCPIDVTHSTSRLGDPATSSYRTSAVSRVQLDSRWAPPWESRISPSREHMRGAMAQRVRVSTMNRLASDSDRVDRTPRRTGTVVGFAVLAVAGLLVAGAAPGVATASDGSVSAAGASSPIPTAVQSNVTEDAYLEPAPDEGDLYFEAVAEDDSWISYMNPRDEYRDPSLGDGSGKICVSLFNEAGDPIVGESVPNTTVTIPTEEELSWHSQADPFVVEYPLTDHYTRPLDSDQFGTSDDVPQGDGYMDAHCLEWHGLPENETVEYGEVEIEGPHADEIEVVGYVQQEHEAWETDVDPIADAVPYEEAGGFTYHPDGSHGQAVIVLQLDEAEEVPDTAEEGADSADWLGFGAVVVLVTLSVTAIAWRRR